LYAVAFAVIVLLLVLTCARMVFIWMRLRCFLKTIGLSSIRDTFDTVPLVDNWGPILHRGIDADQLRNAMHC
jgi:hypothetical protein